MLPPRQRIFEWDRLDIPPVPRLDTPSGRYYVTPDGESLISVTNFLSKIGDKKGLEDWIARVGVEGAEQEKNRAARRGTALHFAIEQYLQNAPDWKEAAAESNLFRQVKTVIDLCMGKVRAIEFGLYSEHLMMGGTADCLGYWSGKLSIIDWKSSTKRKKIEWIDGYFMQACIYSLMLQERTGIKADNLVVVIGTEADTRPRVFEAHRDEWVTRVMTEVKRFHEMQSKQCVALDPVV